MIERIAVVSSTAISMIALAGVALSLLMQRKQTRISQVQASRTMRLELVKPALDDPELLAAWGYREETPAAEARLRAYTNLVFAYLLTAFDLGTITEPELRSEMRRKFESGKIRDFWKNSRQAYLEPSFQSRERLFARIVDDAYRAALSEQVVRAGTEGADNEANNALRNPGEGR
ncbi:MULTISPECIES: DUF6082 family protein [Micromonospora]|uniref:DUF6082 family protein n=1 Tax=Micromonospora TaxID=1873 RepID=UPI0033CB6E27